MSVSTYVLIMLYAVAMEIIQIEQTIVFTDFFKEELFFLIKESLVI